MLCGELEYLKDGQQALGFSGKINTAFIERLNLTLRQSVCSSPVGFGAWLNPHQGWKSPWSGGELITTTADPTRVSG